MRIIFSLVVIALSPLSVTSTNNTHDFIGTIEIRRFSSSLLNRVSAYFVLFLVSSQLRYYAIREFFFFSL
jgi:hypothetical protein